MGQQADYVWHKETDLSGFDCVVLPGGFSYGDYLRSGALARFSPVMRSVEQFASAGGLVLGICNGFQVLCEAGMLPGALVRNSHLEYRCQWTNLRVERGGTPFTSEMSEGQVIRVPIGHGEGNYVADPRTVRDSARLRPRAVQIQHRGGRGHGGREPERLDGQHRGHHERRRQRARHDAAPGAVLRAAARRRGRSAHLPVDHRLRGAGGARVMRPVSHSPTPSPLTGEGWGEGDGHQQTDPLTEEDSGDGHGRQQTPMPWTTSFGLATARVEVAAHLYYYGQVKQTPARRVSTSARFAANPRASNTSRSALRCHDSDRTIGTLESHFPAECSARQIQTVQNGTVFSEKNDRTPASRRPRRGHHA